MPYIEFENIKKEYKMGEVTINALNNTSFSIDKGDIENAKKIDEYKHCLIMCNQIKIPINEIIENTNRKEE